MEISGYKDHKTRLLLFEYINENPGSTFKRLKSTLNLSDSTLRYHLGYLLKRSRIVQEKDGREKCYYSYLKKRFPFSDPKLALNKKQERILQIISIEPLIGYKDLKNKSGMDSSTFKYNMKQLKKKKLIWKVTHDSVSGYDIITKERLSNEMFLIMVNKYLDGEVEKDMMMSIVEKLKDFSEE